MQFILKPEDKQFKKQLYSLKFFQKNALLLLKIFSIMSTFQNKSNLVVLVFVKMKVIK